MRKKRIIIGLIAVIIAIIVCAFIMNYFRNRKNNNEIVLSTNGGSVYKWECDIENSNIASISDASYKRVDDLEGGEVLVYFTITGNKKGTTKASCKYINPSNNSSIDSSNYKIYVDKDLNVTIQNSN